MSAPILVQANDDDVAYFAKRRCQDEHERALWFYLAENAPKGVWIAKDVDTPVGIAIPHAADDEWYLSDLFVEPSFRDHGVAGELLNAAAGPAGEATRSGMLNPDESGGLAFYVARSVPITTPVISVSGEIPREEALAKMAAGAYRFRTAPIDMIAHRESLLALDRDVRGTGRLLDHDYFLQNAQGVAFYLGDEFVAYAYAWPSGRIGPMCTASAAYAVQILAFMLAALKHAYEASWCTMLVPGTNIRILRAAMRANLKIEGVLLFATDRTSSELSRYVGLHRLLF
ncbi:MAG: GNAT family N-acetyltransferase [Acidobacteriales bacterium]|nr:GNAT family N-acetyltransferase [Terriglobales bacterium]